MCYIRQNSNVFQCAPEALHEFRINRIANISPAIATSSLSTLCLFEIASAKSALGPTTPIGNAQISAQPLPEPRRPTHIWGQLDLTFQGICILSCENAPKLITEAGLGLFRLDTVFD